MFNLRQNKQLGLIKTHISQMRCEHLIQAT